MKTEADKLRNSIQYGLGVMDSGSGEFKELSNKIDELFELSYLEGQSSPKIKQLEWKNHGSSITAVGLSDYEYCVNLKDDHTTLSLRNNSQIIVLGPYSRPNEAKAAAQEHFEKRIKECLA